MSIRYADTSALVRCYLVDEADHERLCGLLLEGREPVVTSEITRVEPPYVPPSPAGRDRDRLVGQQPTDLALPQCRRRVLAHRRTTSYWGMTP
ncbi:MAG: hypothetical protein ACRDRI_06590 [Pseudonocardiaceae bacterium]